MSRSAARSRSRSAGTDEDGRDVLSRTMAGAQITIYAGVVSVGIAAFAGIPAGLPAAERGGVISELIMRVGDIIYTKSLLSAVPLLRT